jgi:cysteine synthase A
LAWALIAEAEKQGKIKPGDTIIEATSGNTGIALAMVCAVKGYTFVAVMADSFSVERRKLMKMFGAKLILTPAAERTTGMVNKAEELAKKHGWFLTRQFENEAGPMIHRNTTGVEILDVFRNRRFDYWVTGYGTGGTLTGAGQMIKRARPEVKIICSEPAEASHLSGEKWNPHKIQGWTPDFLPPIVDKSVVDEIVKVTSDEASKAALALASQEGILVGISSGATLAAALKVAEKAEKGSVILAMLPDTGERYLSTWLCESFKGDSDDAWLSSL